MRKHVQYLWWLIGHKWRVFVECCKLGVPWRGIMHDMSKFRRDEWRCYVEWYWGKRTVLTVQAPRKIGDVFRIGQDKERTYVVLDVDEYKVEDKWDVHVLPLAKMHAMETAWMRHQNRNPHHWQFWVFIRDDGSEDIAPMGDAYRREMLADWRALSGDNAAIRDARLHPKTHKWIEAQLCLTN